MFVSGLIWSVSIPISICVPSAANRLAAWPRCPPQTGNNRHDFEQTAQAHSARRRGLPDGFTATIPSDRILSSALSCTAAGTTRTGRPHRETTEWAIGMDGFPASLPSMVQG